MKTRRSLLVPVFTCVMLVFVLFMLWYVPSVSSRRFELADARTFSRQTERGVIVTNPPYGERIGEKEEAEELYRAFGEAVRQCPNWQLYLLSSHTEFERCFGQEADKKRKLYNGMIKCDLFMYYK